MTFDRDNPTSWASRELHDKPLGFSVRAFQKKIDKILGLTENGLPVCRLVWAPDISKTYSKFYCNWTAMGFGTETELRAKYRYATIKIPGTADLFIDIPPPRWIIEEHNSYGQAAESWEAARWNKAGKEVRPPCPLEGYYSELFTISDHDDECCAKNKSVVCWGRYRLPAQQDLDRLQMAKNLRDKDAFINPNAPLSAETLALINLQSQGTRDRNEALKDQKITEFIEENALELIEKFTGQKNTKFSKEKGISV